MSALFITRKLINFWFYLIFSTSKNVFPMNTIYKIKFRITCTTKNIALLRDDNMILSTFIFLNNTSKLLTKGYSFKNVAIHDLCSFIKIIKKNFP